VVALTLDSGARLAFLVSARHHRRSEPEEHTEATMKGETHKKDDKKPKLSIKEKQEKKKAKLAKKSGQIS
jgi:hypothetical protein